MTDDKKKQYSPFNDACRNTLLRHPEAIGVAYKVLNCGCTLICGATAGGLLVESDPPEAEVFVDGRFAGRAPVTGREAIADMSEMQKR